MGAAAAALARSASSAAAIDRGVVRVTASEIMGAEALPAMFAGFRARNPGIAIELVVTNRNQDLARGDADIAVRMIRPTQSGLVARRIGVTRIRLYAHRDYLARFGEPRSLADLANHCFIGFDRDNQTFRSAGSLAKALTREDFGFRCDSDLAQLAALRAGVGVGGCQDMIARRTPELVPVLPNAFQMTLEVWLVMHRDLKTAPRVRLMFDWLAAGLTDYVKGRPAGIRLGDSLTCHSAPDRRSDRRIAGSRPLRGCCARISPRSVRSRPSGMPIATPGRATSITRSARRSAASGTPTDFAAAAAAGELLGRGERALAGSRPGARG